MSVGTAGARERSQTVFTLTDREGSSHDWYRALAMDHMLLGSWINKNPEEVVDISRLPVSQNWPVEARSAVDLRDCYVLACSLFNDGLCLLVGRLEFAIEEFIAEMELSLFPLLTATSGRLSMEIV